MSTTKRPTHRKERFLTCLRVEERFYGGLTDGIFKVNQWRKDLGRNSLGGRSRLTKRSSSLGISQSMTVHVGGLARSFKVLEDQAPPFCKLPGSKILKLACAHPLLSAGSPLPALKAESTPGFLSGEALSGDGQGHPGSGTACPGGPLEFCAQTPGAWLSALPGQLRNVSTAGAWRVQPPAQQVQEHLSSAIPTGGPLPQVSRRHKGKEPVLWGLEPRATSSSPQGIKASAIGTSYANHPCPRPHLLRCKSHWLHHTSLR